MGGDRAASGQAPKEAPLAPEYRQLQRRLASGWNTWDTHSVTEHVLLPEAVAIRVGFYRRKEVSGEVYLADALIGRQEKDAEEVFPGPHSWDGSYSDLLLSWRGLEVRVQSAQAGDDLVLLVTPLVKAKEGEAISQVVFPVGYLWNRAGTVMRLPDRIEAKSAGGRGVSVFLSRAESGFVNLPIAGPYLAAELSGPVGLATGKKRSVEEIEAVLKEQRHAYENSLKSASAASAAADTIETIIGWDTIYEPERGRVVSPVSRTWNVSWGGYVLFDWDTFFAASLAAVGSRDLAYANVVEVLREATPAGFVPNFARSGNWKSLDRSEPPVGAITALGLYRRFQDLWFLGDVFEPLMKWNRWWNDNRREGDYLVWGSDWRSPSEPPGHDPSGKRQGAIFESGLDNSPMYDNAYFDERKQRLEMADVGLLSEYIADCDALERIAVELGKTAEATELRERKGLYSKALQSLWDEKTGIFLNKDLHTGESSERISPTNLYPLLAGVATTEQARRMVHEHLLNPQEFWGNWVIPATPIDDPAFRDQYYWRGRIWGPMNYLVYLGLRNYDEPEVRRELARRSLDLLLKEWKEKGHVHENYNAITGQGDDVSSSDRFYHWGALLGLIDWMEVNDPVQAPSQVK